MNTKPMKKGGGLPADGAGPRVKLSGSLGLKEAKGLCSQLKAALAEGGSVEVDLSDLAGLDTSIAQLLIAARKSAARDGSDLRLVNVPVGSVRTFLVGVGLLGPDGSARDTEEAFWLGAEEVAA